MTFAEKNGFPTMSGWKTYVVSFAIVLIGVSEGVFGADIPGVVVGDDWLQYIISGLGLGSIRAAIGKIIDGVAGN